MKHYLLWIGLAVSLTAASQQPILPRDLPKGPGSTKIRTATPPDLKVEELSLVSVTRDEAAKTIKVQVLIRIKNIGELRSGVSTTEAFIQCPADGGRERKLTATLPVEALNPGASFVKVYTFREAEGSFSGTDFRFWIKADARNQVTESNETNNNSNRITGAVPPR